MNSHAVRINTAPSITIHPNARAESFEQLAQPPPCGPARNPACDPFTDRAPLDSIDVSEDSRRLIKGATRLSDTHDQTLPFLLSCSTGVGPPQVTHDHDRRMCVVCTTINGTISETTVTPDYAPAVISGRQRHDAWHETQGNRHE